MTAPMRLAAKKPSSTYPTPSQPSDSPRTKDQPDVPESQKPGADQVQTKEHHEPRRRADDADRSRAIARLCRGQQQEAATKRVNGYTIFFGRIMLLDVDARERQKASEKSQVRRKIPLIAKPAAVPAKRRHTTVRPADTERSVLGNRGIGLAGPARTRPGCCPAPDGLAAGRAG